ncbi:DUF6779 domain-containing protein [Geodermatophilus sp. SYSU D00710]
MRTTGEDGGARRAASGAGASRRVAGLALGCLAAVAATAVVFLSEDPQVLRIAVVSVAWACLLAAFATARPARDDDEPAGAADRADLHAAHQRELAAVRDTERERTDRARRDAEAAVRRELDALRGELAGLREGLSGLDDLRREVTAAGALQRELHAGLSGLGALRADVGRLRAELTGQLGGPLSGEMRVERVVMHAQSVRTGPGLEPLEPATAAWSADVARELSGRWPAVPASTVAVGVARDEPRPDPWPEPPLPPPPPPAPVARSLPAVPPPPPRPADSPREWLAARGMLDDAPAVPAPADRAPLGRRRTDLPVDLPVPVTTERPTVQRPAVHAVAAGHAGASTPSPGRAADIPDDPGAARLARILAESGVTPGGRRRRYRE